MVIAHFDWVSHLKLREEVRVGDTRNRIDEADEYFLLVLWVRVERAVGTHLKTTVSTMNNRNHRFSLFDDIFTNPTDKTIGDHASISL